MRVKLRPDWEAVKVRVMYDGNRAKFEQHPQRVANLVASGRGKIHFGASSAFWCHWNARIMTLLREEFRAEADGPPISTAVSMSSRPCSSTSIRA